jgi:ABC-type antimicrobial peptide transport system permease subunit
MPIMTFAKLLLRNLLYHWRGNFAVFLGIALGSAVLTGALLVGDSLRGSLKALTLDQLGWVEEAMLPGRFFRVELAREISAERCAPILLLQGSATRKSDDETPVRVGKVTVLGVDASFWPRDRGPEGADFWGSDEEKVVLNETLAKALAVNVDDTVLLYLQKADNIPRETILGNRKAEEMRVALKVKVRAIVPDEGMGRFSLKPTPEPVRNAFVPLRVLQKKLDLAGRANALLASGAKPEVGKHLTLDDWGLRWRLPQDRAEALLHFLDPQGFDDGPLGFAGFAVAGFVGADFRPGLLKRPRWSVKVPDQEALAAEKKGEKFVIEMKKGKKIYWRSRVPDELAETANKNGGILTREAAIDFYQAKRNYFLLESKSMLLSPAIVKTVEELEKQRTDAYAEVSIYIADSISDGKIVVPYSIIAAVEPKRGTLVGQAFQPAGGKRKLRDDEIILVDWPGSILRVKRGGSLTVTYLTPNEKNHLQPKDATFTVRATPKLEGKLDDPDLTPEFPGITDKADMADWQNPPFPYDPKRVKKSDEDYWKRHRTTPKAYVSMATAKELWGSRFGDITSILIAKEGTSSPETLPTELLAALTPEQGGFVFQGVKEQAVKASAGATDFGELFLYFSFFLIVSALLLVGLLVRLNIDRRAPEMGLLLATGWDHWRVRRLLLGEGALLALAGGLVGLGGALLYGQLMLKLLAANWPGGDSLNFLRLHAEPTSFAIGYGASFVVSMLTLFFATRGLAKLSPRSLLSGQTGQTMGLADATPGWSRWLVPVGVIGALALVGAARFLPSGEAQAGCFFGSGALLLTACLAGVWNALKRGNRASSPQPTLSKLGLRNAGRHAVRSVLTVGLLAAASFLIVAVESFHKGTDQEFHEKTGGSGGFAFYAEGSVPVFEDLDQPLVRKELELEKPELQSVRFFPCRVQAGDDASCLNLYKPLKPRVMGVSKALVERGGFHFDASEAQSAAEKTNPWLLLQDDDDDDDSDDGDDSIPAIIDANTAQWILKVKLGDTVEINNDEGKPVKLRIVGLLSESIFQSEILVSEANFLTLFPRQEGFTFFLIDAGTTDEADLKRIEQELGKGLDPIGLDVQTTASRLQGYLAVENTYLATFQALGGLGLILGAAGLAIVLLRGVWERRAELALLSALGFGAGQLAWLVLVENAYLLILGLAAGTISALLAVAPHLVGSGAQVLWLHIAELLGLVLAVGLIAAVLAVWSTLRTPVLTALRRE